MLSRPSITTPIFETNLEDLAARLQGDDSETARELRREVDALREVFRGWQGVRPSDVDRLATIHRLFHIYRSTMDYLTSRR